MIKIVTPKPEATAKDFGCDTIHFKYHIQGHALRVQWETATQAGVKDENDEEWTVSRSLLLPKALPK